MQPNRSSEKESNVLSHLITKEGIRSTKKIEAIYKFLSRSICIMHASAPGIQGKLASG